MKQLTRSDLLSLEQYAQERDNFRARVMAHKKARHIALGDNLRLLFEDRLTIQYQIQEMLRAERIFEASGIEEELAAYNPLIPDGDNWKATLMIEYADVDERRSRLADLVGIEHSLWIKIDDLDPVYAIADEDLERSTDEKTSSVHFLRFQLTPEMVTAAKQGKPLSIGVNHPHYSVVIHSLDEHHRLSLVADLG